MIQCYYILSKLEELEICKLVIRQQQYDNTRSSETYISGPPGGQLQDI